jgi:hypothetical protein
MRGPAFEPRGVQTVPGPKCIAFPDPLKAQEKIAVAAGPNLFESIREPEGR